MCCLVLREERLLLLELQPRIEQCKYINVNFEMERQAILSIFEGEE